MTQSAPNPLEFLVSQSKEKQQKFWQHGHEGFIQFIPECHASYCKHILTHFHSQMFYD